MRYAFGHMGWRSLILHPDLITGHEHIYIGDNVFIRQHARLEAIPLASGLPPRLEILDGTHAEFYFHVACANHVRIGRHVLIAGRVFITDHDHVFTEPNRPILEQGLSVHPVNIGDYVWLGEGVIVLKGVHIGDNAIVGAGSIVTNSIPAGAIAVGIPAKVIGYRKGYKPIN